MHRFTSLSPLLSSSSPLLLPLLSLSPLSSCCVSFVFHPSVSFVNFKQILVQGTACDGPAHMHAFFFLVSFRPVLKHGPKSVTVEQVFFVGAKPASALKALAWTSAQATDCDLKSRLRNSISVWCLSPFSLSLFFLFSLFFSLFLRLSVSLSPFSAHHHSYLHVSNFIILSMIFICYALYQTRVYHYHAVFFIFHVIWASSGNENDPKPAGRIEKRFLIFLHFGRF